MARHEPVTAAAGPSTTRPAVRIQRPRLRPTAALPPMKRKAALLARAWWRLRPRTLPRTRRHFAARPRRAICFAAALSFPHDDCAFTYRSHAHLSRCCHKIDVWAPALRRTVVGVLVDKI